MQGFFNISPDEMGSRDGGGPEDDSRFPSLALRSHGFIALTFGFALGLTFMIFFGLFRLIGAPTSNLGNFVSRIHPNLWLSFLYGFVGGILISGIYNCLIFRRFNLFGQDRNVD